MPAAFSLTDLVCAVRASLGPAMADRVYTAFPCVVGSDADDFASVSFSAAARLIAYVLQTDMVAPEPCGPRLRAVELRADARSVTLSPDEAKLHPLAGAWVGDCLSDGIERLMLASADLSMMAGSAPVQWFWVLGGDGSEPTAELHLSFANAPAVNVVALYGPPQPPYGIETQRRVHGGNIAGVGAVLAELSMSTNVNIAAEGLEAQAAGGASPQTLH